MDDCSTKPVLGTMKHLLLNQFLILAGGFAVATGWGIRKTSNKAKRSASPVTRNVARHVTQTAPVKLHSCLSESKTDLSFVREYLKLSIRSRIHKAENKKWLEHWNSSTELTQIASATPGVLKKIYRPYLTSQLICSDRLDVITSHYAFITRQGLVDIVARAAKAPVTLAQFKGKSDKIYQIELAAIGVMEREGELVLQLVNEGVLMFSLAFTFFDHAGPLRMAVGCLQGGRSEDSLERIRLATRDMFGLRPKTLMVRLAQQIGYQFGCRDLLLVGNQNRVVTQPLRKGIVFADYDTTWEELGAARRLDGDFKLPCVALAEPDLQAIASSKRSEARKKFALLSSVSELTCAGLRA